MIARKFGLGGYLMDSRNFNSKTETSRRFRAIIRDYVEKLRGWNLYSSGRFVLSLLMAKKNRFYKLKE